MNQFICREILQKSKVLSIINKPDPGELLADRLGAAVRGTIVHHNDLNRPTRGGLAHRGKAVEKQFPGIPVNYDN